MNFIITFSLVLLFVSELMASPATQKYAPYLSYNGESYNRSSSIRTRKINEPIQETTYYEEFPDYPKNYIENLKEDLEKFEYLFVEDINPMVEVRFDAVEEKGLCESRKRTIYPKRGMTRHGYWLTIVNQDDDKFRQGVLVEECSGHDQQCEYSRNFPLGVESKCKQSSTFRSLVALTNDGKIITEHFQFPSCCKCVVSIGHGSRNTNRFGDESKPKVARYTDPDRYIFPH